VLLQNFGGLQYGPSSSHLTTSIGIFEHPVVDLDLIQLSVEHCSVVKTDLGGKVLVGKPLASKRPLEKSSPARHQNPHYLYFLFNSR